MLFTLQKFRSVLITGEIKSLQEQDQDQGIVKPGTKWCLCAGDSEAPARAELPTWFVASCRHVSAGSQRYQSAEPVHNASTTLPWRSLPTPFPGRTATRVTDRLLKAPTAAGGDKTPMQAQSNAAAKKSFKWSVTEVTKSINYQYCVQCMYN